MTPRFLPEAIAEWSETYQELRGAFAKFHCSTLQFIGTISADMVCNAEIENNRFQILFANGGVCFQFSVFRDKKGLNGVVEAYSMFTDDYVGSFSFDEQNKEFVVLTEREDEIIANDSDAVPYLINKYLLASVPFWDEINL